ncbi:MAG: transcriptional regulator [Gemmatimonadetes bacterium]|nr:transcriptional regulator [Gemmatimonadota bacterium]
MATLLDFTKPHVLRTEEEYEAAVQEIGALLDRAPEPGTEEHDLLEFLTVLVQAYDAEHYPDEMFATTPQAVVDFALEQSGMTRAQLAEPMGGRSRVSDFFSGKRPLSRQQIVTLRDLLGIPADLLL